MDAATLQGFRTRLRALHDELQSVRAFSSEAAGTVELDQSRVGRLSRMDAMQMQAMSAETNRRRHLQLARIESALVRMDAGDYGACTACGEDIDPRRLESDPAVLLCIRCATEVERRS
jgi:DnaK suppressor protein